MTGGLQDKDVLTAHVLQHLDIDFSVGKARHLGLPALDPEVAESTGDEWSQGPVSDAAATVFEDDDGFPDSAHEMGAGNEVVTETIAELYARQGLHDRAASVYRELIRRRGGDATLEQRLTEIERAARQEQEGAPEGAAEAPGAPAEEAPLALADEEALLTPSLDAGQPQDEESDPFAASFAEGFTTVVEQDDDVMEAYLEGTEPDVTYGYDLLGRMTSASYSGHALSFTL